MARIKLPWGTYLAYTAYTVLIFCVGLVLTFPMDKVAERLVATAGERTGWHFEVVGADWMPLTGLKMDALIGTPPGGEPMLVQDVRLGVAAGKLRQGTLLLDHRANLFGGDLSGLLEATDLKKSAAYTWSGQVNQLNLAELPAPPKTTPLGVWMDGATLEGKVDASGQAGWRRNELLRGNGDMTIGADGLVIHLARSPLGAINLPLGDIDARLTWQRGRVEVQSLTIQGKVVKGEGSGRIVVGRTAAVSRLDLRFTGTLEESFPMRDIVAGMLKSKGEPVTISLRGTLANPILYVNGKTINQLMAGR